MATKLGNINLFVRDIEQARRFYAEALGLQENPQLSAPPNFFLFDAGGCTLTLQDAATPGAAFEPGNNWEIGFEVEDIEAVREKLRSFGVEVSEVQQMGWASGFDARDCEGNRLAIYRKRSA